jgi:hypothetical protein
MRIYRIIAINEKLIKVENAIDTSNRTKPVNKIIANPKSVRKLSVEPITPTVIALHPELIA